MADRTIVVTSLEQATEALRMERHSSTAMSVTLQGLVVPEVDALKRRVQRLEDICLGLVELLAEHGIEAGGGSGLSGCEGGEADRAE